MDDRDIAAINGFYQMAAASPFSTIVAITANNKGNDDHHSLQAGNGSHLVKAVSRATLLAKRQRLHQDLSPRARYRHR
jgi:CheY-like chemotaxis protein